MPSSDVPLFETTVPETVIGPVEATVVVVEVVAGADVVVVVEGATVVVVGATVVVVVGATVVVVVGATVVVVGATVVVVVEGVVVEPAVPRDTSKPVVGTFTGVAALIVDTNVLVVPA